MFGGLFEKQMKGLIFTIKIEHLRVDCLISYVGNSSEIEKIGNALS